MLPTIGRIVHYTLNEQDATEINRRRADFTALTRTGAVHQDPTGYVGHVGNHAQEGDVYPAIVVRTFGGGTTTNLHVLLDGNDTLWATSRQEGDQPGTWTWPPRA